MFLDARKLAIGDTWERLCYTPFLSMKLFDVIFSLMCEHVHGSSMNPLNLGFVEVIASCDVEAWLIEHSHRH